MEDPNAQKLAKYFRNRYNISSEKGKGGLMCVTITDEIEKQIPFEYLSIDYKNNKRTRLVLNEIVSTMKQQKKIGATTKENTYALVELYALIDRVSVEKGTFRVIDKTKLFRDEDKFCYRLVENLDLIFKGIRSKISTQYVVHDLLRAYKIDIAIKISNVVVIGIEFDEEHHKTRDNQIVDTAKRDRICRLINLRIFKKTDNFDNFLKAIAHDIIQYHDIPELKETKLDCIARLIRHNIQAKRKEIILLEGITNFVGVLDCQIVHINDLANIILNMEIRDVRKSIKQYVKNGLIDENDITYDDNNKIDGVRQEAVLMFVMATNNNECDPYRIMIISIIQQYFLIMKGNYNVYSYMCTPEKTTACNYDDALEFASGERQIDMRADRLRQGSEYGSSDKKKVKKGKSIKDFSTESIFKPSKGIESINELAKEINKSKSQSKRSNKVQSGYDSDHDVTEHENLSDNDSDRSEEDDDIV